MKNVKIGILGMGTIGTGVYELLSKHRDLICKKSGVDIRIVKIADIDGKRKKDLKIDNEVFTTDPYRVVDDPEIEIVVELIGGTTVSKELLLRAARNKKHIVTANKALLAEYGKEIIGEVVKNEVELGFEASVCGGIPIIKTVKEALIGNDIQKIVGIVNGTTNFILTRMSKEGLNFKESLKIAQRLGFAEKDSYLDISGGDASHKITILASLAFNTLVELPRVWVEGIDSMDIKDIQYADEFGFVIKLLAIAEKRGENVLVMVHPTLVSKNNPLANIMGEENAIMLCSDFLGTSMYYGKGAGSWPTASAVVADVADIAIKINNNFTYNKNSYSFFQDLKQLDFSRNISRYYFRFNAPDKPGILSKISGVLGENNISIASVIQKETEEVKEHVPLVIMTHKALEADVIKSIKKIDALPELKGESKVIRVLD